MNSTPRATADFVVVDANTADYDALCDATHRIVLLRSAEHALRTPHANAIVWMINMRLPDITGIELLRLLRRRFPYSAVYLIGDVYSLEDELAARACGATAYFCKPANPAWLEARTPRCRSPALPQRPAKRPPVPPITAVTCEPP